MQRSMTAGDDISIRLHRQVRVEALSLKHDPAIDVMTGRRLEHDRL
jgi:hypothetical protein